jgi:hypothetical protein
MKVAKIAPAPMLRKTGIRLPISAHVKPPSTSTTIIVGPSDLTSPTATSAAIRTTNKKYIGKGIMPIRKSVSRHQPSGQKGRAPLVCTAELLCDEVASTSCADMLVPSWWQVRAFDRFNQVVAARGRPPILPFSL